VQIPKEQVLEFVLAGGDSEESLRAYEALPDCIDTDRDWHLLERLGVDEQDVVRQFNGSSKQTAIE
jgi:hypothetical protein